jgi:uncharacterized protein
MRPTEELPQPSGPVGQPLLDAAVWITASLLIALAAYLLGRLFLSEGGAGWQAIAATLGNGLFWSAVAVGLIAQAVDGALGMAYGVTSTTFLLALGASPSAASASVHMAEVFTTGVSGISHARFGNVDRRLFLKLLVPGILGTVLGAVLVTQADGAALKPFISAYLLLLGLFILSKAFRRFRPPAPGHRHVGKLALFGGFVDAAGGGGWGPVVTTTLIGSGHDPRTTIGSVNFAEFFLTLAGAASFALLMETNAWTIIAGLVLGGMLAAPFAALLCRNVSARSLLLLVGSLISALSFYTLYGTLSA